MYINTCMACQSKSNGGCLQQYHTCKQPTISDLDYVSVSVSVKISNDLHKCSLCHRDNAFIEHKDREGFTFKTYFILCKYHKCVIPVCDKHRTYSKFLCADHCNDLTIEDSDSESEKIKE